MDATSFDPLAGLRTPTEVPGAELPAELGRDEFLQLLVTKLTNQNPLEPAQDTEFIAQLASFSSLEQLIDMNDRLGLVAQAQVDMVNSQALNLIGKEALVEAGNEIRIKGGAPDTLVYALPKDAASASIDVFDAEGNLVKTLELDPVARGRVTLDWDGLDEDGDPLPDGDYTLRVNVIGTDDEPLTIALFRSAPIDGVTFINGTIALISGDREIPFNSILEFRDGRA